MQNEVIRMIQYTFDDNVYLMFQGIVENAKISVAMEEFSKVLYHKRFLKVLIQTLDNTPSISAMDR